MTHPAEAKLDLPPSQTTTAVSWPVLAYLNSQGNH